MRDQASMYVPSAEGLPGPSAEIQKVYQDIRETGRQLSPGVSVLVRRWHNDPERTPGVVRTVEQRFYGLRVVVRCGRRNRVVCGDCCEICKERGRR